MEYNSTKNNLHFTMCAVLRKVGGRGHVQASVIGTSSGDGGVASFLRRDQRKNRASIVPGDATSQIPDGVISALARGGAWNRQGILLGRRLKERSLGAQRLSLLWGRLKLPGDRRIAKFAPFPKA